jgi:hypothetical protein
MTTSLHAGDVAIALQGAAEMSKLATGPDFGLTADQDGIIRAAVHAGIELAALNLAARFKVLNPQLSLETIRASFGV